MANGAARKPSDTKRSAGAAGAARPSALLDTRVIYCGDCLDQLAKLPDGCVDLIYIDPPVQQQPQLRGLLGRDRAVSRAGVCAPAKLPSRWWRKLASDSAEDTGGQAASGARQRMGLG